MDLLTSLLKEFGVRGFILVVIVYFILKSEIRIVYPRAGKNV